MSDTSAATQAAFIAKYRGDATLQGLMLGSSSPEWNIFDYAGSGQTTPTFPYVYVHPITASAGNLLTMGTDAMDVFMQVDIFTSQADVQGFSQARSIAARIYALTHGPVAGQFALSSGANVLTLFDNRQELVEVTDQPIQRIVDRYKLFNQG